MHLLTCPECNASIDVAPSQAGGETACPACNAVIAIPKLGELRKLPRSDREDDQPTAVASPMGGSAARVFGFVLCGLVAVIALLFAGFCGVRWYVVGNPTTTQQHIDMLRSDYKDLSGALLIREYEGMERYGLDLTIPYRYIREQETKDLWGLRALVLSGIAVVSLAACVGFGRSGRRSQRSPQAA